MQRTLGVANGKVVSEPSSFGRGWVEMTLPIVPARALPISGSTDSACQFKAEAARYAR
jgi:hypothetical protein